jgi:hypothetical protein
MNRGSGGCLLYSALTVLALWISTMYSTSSAKQRALKRKRLEPSDACDDLQVEITDGPMPQITSPKSPSLDADRESPISYRLDELLAYRNATSPFRD